MSLISQNKIKNPKAIKLDMAITKFTFSLKK
jgi:hypothetical protein